MLLKFYVVLKWGPCGSRGIYIKIIKQKTFVKSYIYLIFLFIKLLLYKCLFTHNLYSFIYKCICIQSLAQHQIGNTTKEVGPSKHNYNNQYFIMGPSPRQGPLLLNSTINPCPTPLHIVFLGKKIKVRIGKNNF